MPASGGSAGNGSAGALHELASGKKATPSSQEVGNEASHGNDNNNATTRWCAVDGTFPQWWRVDLGASHAPAQVSIKFERTDRQYYYVVETSPDNLVYTQQITASCTGSLKR